MALSEVLFVLNRSKIFRGWVMVAVRFKFCTALVDLFKLHPILLVLPEPLGRGVLSVVLPPKPMNEFSRQKFILNLKINYGYFGRFY